MGDVGCLCSLCCKTGSILGNALFASGKMLLHKLLSCYQIMGSNICQMLSSMCGKSAGIKSRSQNVSIALHELVLCQVNLSHKRDQP